MTEPTLAATLAELAEQISPPTVLAAEPPPGLGRLGELARWLAAAQGRWPPTEPARIRAVFLNPAVDPADRPADRAAGELAELVGVTLAPVGTAAVGMTSTGTAAVGTAPVGSAGTASVGTAAGGTVAAAVDAGLRAADAEVDAGADLLLAAAAGADVAGIALVAAATAFEPTDAVGRGLDDRAWMRTVAAVRDLVRALRRYGAYPAERLSTVDSPALGLLTGLLLRAAQRRTPVLVDGVAGCAAALLAAELAPGAVGWWQVAGVAGSPAETAVLDRLGLRPLLNLEVAAVPGYAALLAVPLVRAAARLTAGWPEPPGTAGPALAAPSDPPSDPPEPPSGMDGG
ncbi:MAG TPA: nicotinate-nucleotide--dimethylbenzimidazole phosphoribosyltransferase [Mycobacteriales bacterium]|nr:nicotinate-nucleotide--dimethylbenzimidazole phosphoribosyltransferase [Mycobacteriales bacterium]